MLYLEIPENTAYNPMIYITFFIVILIDKRGVREAEREAKERKRTYEHITINITIHITKRGKHEHALARQPARTRKEASSDHRATSQPATHRHTTATHRL